MSILQHFATLTGDDRLSSPLLAGFEQPIGPLFAGVPRMEEG